MVQHMKKLSFIIALVLVLTIGGVYATFGYTHFIRLRQ